EQGFTVRVLDNLSTGSEKNLSQVVGKFEFIQGSVEDAELCRRVCDGARYICHLAALGGVPRSLSDPMASNSTNVTGTLAVLWAARQAGVERVVFASSASVYGQRPPLPQSPEHPPHPSSPYAVTKLAGEYYCSVFYECYGLETVVLRYFNVFGTRQDPLGAYASVIPCFFKALMAGEPPRIEGDGEQGRDFVYVSDCVEGTIKAMSTPGVAGKIYNIASGRQTSVNELYSIISKILGTNLEPKFVHGRAGDIRHSQAELSTTVSDLGYKPSYTLESGLKEVSTWYRGYFARKASLELG
ncbi:NAD-dependent epimerase/dehydratase family protein, partial [bacterium]|nr:NAD-dependent epimerase/dehydratase family protein [bacterium]